MFITAPNGVGMTDLGTLGGGASAASELNDAGQVVGNSHFSGGGGTPHAFIASSNGADMTDLNSSVDLPTGVFLAKGQDINNLGQVAAVGVIP